MEKLGAKLKKIRLEKGLTLEEAHKKTKIHLNILRTLEEDSLVNFSPVYIKGFLKIYCNYLGVDPRDCIPDYKESSVALPTRAVKAPSYNPDLFKRIRNGMKRAAPAVVILIAVMVMFRLGKFIFSKNSTRPKKSSVVKLQKTLPHRIAAVKPQGPKETVSVIRLGIRSKEDCWVQVKSDGKVIFQNILRRGRFENWQAKEKIELALGSAGAVELEINGRLISSLGRRGQSIKNILITKEGLSTSR